MLFTLVLIEGGLRAAGVRYQSSFFRTDWTRGYVYRPNAQGWWVHDDVLYDQINSQGHHDRVHTLAKPAGVIRIAVIGSSYVGGMQVTPDNNFVYLLEGLLNSRPGATQRVETLNFGIDAYSVVQTFYALKDVWQFHPDIVIFNITHIDLLDAMRETAWNKWGSRPFFELDANGEVVPDRITRLIPVPTPAQLDAQDRWNDLLNRSHLALASNAAYYKALARLTKKPPERPDPYTSNPDYQYILPLAPPPLNGPMEKNWQILQALVPQFKRLAEQHGAELWFVSTGMPPQEYPDPAFRERFRKRVRATDLFYWDKRVDSIVRSNGLHSLRLAPLMADYATKHNVYLHGFFFTPCGDGHWNAKGNHVAAQFIADDLLKSSRLFKKSQ